MNEIVYKVDALLGHVALDTELRLVGDRLVGFGRKRVYNREGVLIETTTWQETGAALCFPEPESKGIFGWFQRRRNRAELRRLAGL